MDVLGGGGFFQKVNKRGDVYLGLKSMNLFQAYQQVLLTYVVVYSS